jgi:hypothetical protein
MVYNPLSRVRKNAVNWVVIRRNQSSGLIIDRNAKTIVASAKIFLPIEIAEMIINPRFIFTFLHAEKIASLV